MRKITMTFAAALAAAAFTAAPAAAEEPKYCDPGPCPVDVIERKLDGLAGPTVDKVLWAVECAGYSLGGNPCTG